LSKTHYYQRVFWVCPEGTENYLGARNSVEAIPFELARALSIRKPFWGEDRRDLVRDFVERKRTATPRRIEQFTGVRRETAGAYLKSGWDRSTTSR